MGTFTPNIGLYIPAAGETNYNDAFAQGMINLDQHDHTGGPNKGLPITSTGLADFSVTYQKLNSNVVDPTTGIGVNSSPGFQNQLQILGILRNLYTLAGVPGVGFVAMNGATVAARTFQDTATTTWTNPSGIAGNPQVDVNISGLSPVGVANGGTGVTSLSPYDIICGGTGATSPVQQVSGEGTLDQYLASTGPGALPIWKTLPAAPTQNLLQATVTITAAEFTNLAAVPKQLVAAPSAGQVLVPYNCYAKLNYAGTPFGGGSNLDIAYSAISTATTGMEFKPAAFKDSNSGYYWVVNDDPGLSSNIPSSRMEARPLVLQASGSNYTGGAGATVTISLQYSIIQI